MHLYFVLLFLITFASGVMPVFFKVVTEKHLQLLLAFSGAFLLGISMLHLLPETFAEIGNRAGGFIFAGFFFQFIIQRFTHGAEHGHIHHHGDHGHAPPLWPILIGLSIHAFLEGLPLGFEYHHAHTTSSVFFGVVAHKIPEAFTLGSLLVISRKHYKWIWIILFAAISPLAALLANYFGHTQHYVFVEDAVAYLIPVVIGAFIHISTTILYESGTRQHEMSRKKIVAILLGVLLSSLTLLFHQH